MPNSAAPWCRRVVISSHGGPTLSQPGRAAVGFARDRAAVGGRLLILADSGVRRGSDIAKLIGAGADAVLAGRAFLWALAAGGEQGVVRMADSLQDQLRGFMAFSGMASLADLRRARWIDELPRGQLTPGLIAAAPD